METCTLWNRSFSPKPSTGTRLAPDLRATLTNPLLQGGNRGERMDGWAEELGLS